MIGLRYFFLFRRSEFGDGGFGHWPHGPVGGLHAGHGRWKWKSIPPAIDIPFFGPEELVFRGQRAIRH